jgi:chorismate lyase/3-hydroxybenzoate synthase
MATVPTPLFEHGRPLAVRAWAPPDSREPLAAIATAGAAGKLPHPLALPLPALGGSSRAEFWLGERTPRRESGADGELAWTDTLLFGALRVPEAGGDIAGAAERGYARLLAACARLGFPHVIRVWNWFGAINAGEGDAERYRRFCVGRARVIPSEPATGYAAATAIGVPAAPDALTLHWLAATRPGVPVENPRQVSAWEYPREYGPIAPGFSRAMLLEWCDPPLLLVSGTASVLGHASAHADPLAQLDESLTNVDALLVRAAARVGRPAKLGPDSLLRVYVREAREASRVAAHLVARLGAQTPAMLLHGDVCRRELAVEIEAVHRFA